MYRHFIVVTVCILIQFTSPVVCAESTLTPTQLPRSVRPTHYAVSLTPDASKAKFVAKVDIHLEVLKPTSTITLNAKNLTFQQAQLSVDINSSDEKKPVSLAKAVNIKVNAIKQTATFEFAHPIVAGLYTLSIDYSGVINTQANGLFLIDYDTSAGRKRALYTQFEHSDARRFIPSWDEPAYKATFSLEVTVPDNQMAVSNMPVLVKKELADGRNVIRFATTPSMSTYLLFFGLGEFERATDMVGSTEVGVITQKGVLSQAAFPLAATKEILSEYNDYFDVRYPLPKLDNIAAPGSSQFFAAMENWGAIFTFENSMLLDPTISTQKDKERSFIIAAHEMAHQWFGDLVTMRWWDDLWLNEGFASWMESRTTERLHPEWVTKLTTVDTHEAAMELDSLPTTHSIVQRIDTADQVSQAFDKITYQKGESVIHMLENYVGANVWREGVRSYIKKHAYGNTTTDDFWQAIEQTSKQPIATIAHDFTLQPGVPLIKVNDVSCKDGKTNIQLTQGEFSRDHADKKPLTWHVPVTLQLLGTTQTAQTLVANGKAAVQLVGCGPVIVNAGQTGYFRTLYSPQQFTQLIKSFALVDPIDQLGLLSDSWSLGLTGLQPISDFLNLANATPLNADPQIWNKIADIYNAIYLSYQSAPIHQQQFAQFAIAHLSPVLAKLSWDARTTDSSAILNLREKLIEVLSQLGDSVTITNARQRYAARETNTAGFPVALRKVIMKVVALHADVTTWNQLHAAAQVEKSAMIKDQLYRLIAASNDPALARRALAIAITNEPGATNSAEMIEEVARLHPDLAVDFTIAHFAQVEKFVDSSSRSRYLPRIATGSAQPAMINKLKTYANKLPKSARGSTNVAIANIQYQINARINRLPEINVWLDARQ